MTAKTETNPHGVTENENVYFENAKKGEEKIVLNKKQCDFMRVILDKFAQIDSKNKHI